MKYLHENNLILTYYGTKYYAALAFGNNVESLIFLHENGYEITRDEMFEEPILKDNLEYLHEVKGELNEKMLIWAFSLNKKSLCLDYLIKNNCPRTENVTFELVKNRKLRSLKNAVNKYNIPIDATKCLNFINENSRAKQWKNIKIFLNSLQ